MTNFYDTLNTTHAESDLIRTENGAMSLRGSGDILVDLNNSVNSMRNLSEREIMKKFQEAYLYDPEGTVKDMFHIGDVREGKGERRTFDAAMNYIGQAHPGVAKELIPLIPEYTRWDHVVSLCVHPKQVVAKEAMNLIKNQLKEDLEYDQMTLKEYIDPFTGEPVK